jgi:hypothetical protein
MVDVMGIYWELVGFNDDLMGFSLGIHRMMVY